VGTGNRIARLDGQLRIAPNLSSPGNHRLVPHQVPRDGAIPARARDRPLAHYSFTRLELPGPSPDAVDVLAGSNCRWPPLVQTNPGVELAYAV
jgi:hypothetical protein